MQQPEEVLSFWLKEVGPKGWYQPPEGLDETIAGRFGPLWNRLMSGGCAPWLTHPPGVLAYTLVTDQFSRNMYRGTPLAFAADAAARAAVKVAIAKKWDLKVDPPERQFFYMPLVHHECLADQERAVRLFSMRMPDAGGNLLHARVHREIIRRFGRFPFRNEALGRHPTAGETEFMENGGYVSVLRELEPEDSES